MPDGIPASRKFDFFRQRVDKIDVFHLPRIGREIRANFANAQPLDRPSDQCRDIRMRVRMQPGLRHSFHIIRSAAGSFRAGNQQVIPGKSQRTWIPFGGDEANGQFHR